MSDLSGAEWWIALVLCPPGQVPLIVGRGVIAFLDVVLSIAGRAYERLAELGKLEFSRGQDPQRALETKRYRLEKQCTLCLRAEPVPHATSVARFDLTQGSQRPGFSNLSAGIRHRGLIGPIWRKQT
jgi:hypothetical protein